MRKLLTSTAICLVFVTGFSSVSHSTKFSVFETYNTQEFAEISMKQNIFMVSTGFYQGDFQQIARAVQASNMYSGDGAAQMGNTRMFRY